MFAAGCIFASFLRVVDGKPRRMVCDNASSVAMKHILCSPSLDRMFSALLYEGSGTGCVICGSSVGISRRPIRCFDQCCYKSSRRGQIIRLSSRQYVASFLSSGDRTHCLQSRSSAMGVVTHASSPVERSRPRLWPGHRRRNCAEDAGCRHSAEPQRAPGFVQKVKCSHLYFFRKKP